MTHVERATPPQRATTEGEREACQSNATPTSVFIIGAGPVGLTLACELAWRGVRVRIIDSQPAPSLHSKAIGVFPRTLELLENQGIPDDMVRSGVPLEGILLHAGHRRLAKIDARQIPSHYNFILTLAQSETERLLIKRLSELGVSVERPVALVALEHRQDSVRIVLQRPNEQRETCDVPWVVGCDGAHSFVRNAINLSFEGERYSEAFNLADVTLSGEPVEAKTHILLFLADTGPLFIAPFVQPQQYRIIAAERPGSAAVQRDTPTLEDVRSWWRERVSSPTAQHVDITHVEWSSRFTIHRRMVKRLRTGRVLLAGDAAHIHSPAGAQGMNGGMQDAINLAWKLALVCQGRSPVKLLDTYGEERLPVAHMVHKATHLVTKAATLHRPALRTWRNGVMRVVLNTPIQRRLIRAAAGLAVRYRRSSIVCREQRGVLLRVQARVARHRGPAPGDRAPDVQLGQDGHRLYHLLRHPGYTLLVFTGPHPTAQTMEHASAAARTMAAAYGDVLQSHVITAQQHDLSASQEVASIVCDADSAVHILYGMRNAGLCLIRPDRYIACQSQTLDCTHMQAALRKVIVHNM